METLAAIRTTVVTEKMILRIWYLRLARRAIRGERSEMNKKASMVWLRGIAARLSDAVIRL
jgi:hypothetical protein